MSWLHRWASKQPDRSFRPKVGGRRPAPHPDSNKPAVPPPGPGGINKQRRHT